MAEKYQKLKKKHVLVIGGTSGVGYAVAEACLASGAYVTVSGSQIVTTNEAVLKLKQDFPQSKISGTPCELAEPAGLEGRLEELFSSAAKSYPISHVVFTSGDKHHPKSLSEMSYESMLECGNVRFFAAALTAKVAQKYLHPGPECSITLSNGYVSSKPIQGWVPETAWAAAIEGLTRSLAVDMKPVRVNAVSLGVFDTPLLQTSFGQYRDAIIQRQGQTAMTGEIGKAEDVAEMYLGLMKNHNCTASVVTSDAGLRFV